MALTETRTAETLPDREASAIAADAPTTLDGIVGSADHKTIGRLWIGAGLLFLVAGLAVTAVVGIEAVDLSGLSIVADADEFTQLWSLGRTVVLFGGIVPILVGIGTFVVPLQVGAPAIAFARGASGAFWTWLMATVLLVVAYILNGGPGGGRVDSVVLWAAALGAMLAAIAWALLTIATTVLGARTTGMTLDRVPPTSWAFFVFSLVGLFSLPIIMVELVLVYVRMQADLISIDARQSLAGVMEASNLPPALYWVAIPALGMAADVIATHTGRPLSAHKAVLGAIGVFGLVAYGADFLGLASVRPLQFTNGLLVATTILAVLPILAVLGLSSESLRRGSLRFTAAMVGALLSGLILLLGAATAILGVFAEIAVLLDRDTSISVDLNSLLILHGTTFHDGVRGLVLGSAVLAVTAGLHHWAPKIWSRRMTDSLGFLSILATAGGAVLWGLGAVLAGVDDQPAYPVSILGGGDSVEFFNTIALVGIVLVAAGAALTALNALGAAVGATDHDAASAWQGATLEWATDTPVPFGNFATAPIVRSAAPLHDEPIETGDDAGSDAEVEEA